MRSLRSRLALVPAAAALVLVSACGSAEDTASDGDDTTTVESTSPETTESTAEETTESTETEATEQPSGGDVAGAGYRVALPDGWEDVTQQAADSQPLVDIAIADPSGSFRTNFNVVKPQPFSGTTRELVKQSAIELRSVTNNKVTPVAPTEFDGVRAPGQTSSIDTDAGNVTLIQYMVVRGDQIHPVTMTFLSELAPDSKAVMEEIIASWKWE